MDTPRRPDDFDWVAARRACAIEAVFEVLAAQARRNVEAMRGAAAASLSVIDTGTTFTVLAGASRKARFRLVGGVVEVDVFGLARSVQLRATVGLNDDGDCRLRVEGHLLQPWQLLRRVLEPLFFPADAEA